VPTPESPDLAAVPAAPERVEAPGIEKRDPGPSQEVEPPGGTGGDTISEPMAATHDHDGCPDPEEIAAFLDGTLSRIRRARLIEHLASCERCYEVFAGAADFMGESAEEPALLPAEPRRPFEPATGGGEPGRRDRRAAPARFHRWRWAAAAALAAVLAVAAGTLLVGWRDRQLLSTERYARHVAVSALATAPFAWGRTLRGGAGEGEEVPLDQTSFKLGVRLLDLRAALAAGNRESAEVALQRLGPVLKDVVLLPPEIPKAYQEMADQLRAGAVPGSLLSAASTWEKQLFQVFKDDPNTPLYVAVGSWTEACRLAGEARQPGLFRDSATRRLLGKVVAPGEDDASHLLGEAPGAILRAIRADVAAGRIDPAALGKRCRSLLEQLDPD
jgi:hypothetical protein